MARTNRKPEDRKKEIEEAKKESGEKKTMFGQPVNESFKAPERKEDAV